MAAIKNRMPFHLSKLLVCLPLMVLSSVRGTPPCGEKELQFEQQLRDYCRASDLVFSGRVEEIGRRGIKCTIKSMIKGDWSATRITLADEHVTTDFRSACFGRELRERDSRVFFARASSTGAVLLAHVHVSKIALSALRSLGRGAAGMQRASASVAAAVLALLALAASGQDAECPLEKWTLDERQNRSQVAFTALVESCGDVDDAEHCQRRLLQQQQPVAAAADEQLSLSVRIKKIFKGLNRLWEGRLVRVDGVRDRRLCPSRVRLRDTRIFLANYADQHAEAASADGPGSESAVLALRLNSSLISVSLRHLQQLRAYTKDAQNDVRSSTMSTAAPLSLPIEDKPDPCAGLKCPPGAKCVVSADASSATCQCPTKCPSYGDSVGSRPVCGVDGNDYANMCELHKSSCLANRMIEVKFHGACDPCAGVECPSPSVCILDSERRPHCRCGTTCPADFQPVCGSDGRSYSSQCHLMQEACRSQRQLRILYKGLCETGVHPCSKAGCEPDEECQVDEKGMPQCLCPGPCPPIHRPVCASDQRTYSSVCELQRESCRHKRNITLVHEGACGASQACGGYRCPAGGYCVENPPGFASCHCPACGGEWDPVCGSDGVTYTNPCRLRYEACRHNKSLSVVYKGLCNGCDKKQCDFYATCETDETGRPECVCPKGCSQLANAEVCGTDGITYRNECELKQAACRQQQFIVVASPGDCDICKRVQCEHGARCEDGVCVCPRNCPTPVDPLDSSVCSSDGRTYSSECHMQQAACDHGLALHVLHSGPCPTPPADLVLPPSDYHDASSIPSSGGHHARRCHCNKQGSVDGTCDPVTMQCRCLPGVGGRACDRCLSGFWGLHAIGATTKGCEPCDCHRTGSIRGDCEQMTGRCVCRANVVGLKCDRCRDGQLLDDAAAGGCAPNAGLPGGEADEALENESRHCSDLTCRFGAICQDLQGQAVCVCPMDCPVTSSAEHTVCGSDGVSYGSECDLRLAACRKQVSVIMAYEGPCSDDVVGFPAPAAPASEPDASVSKATRHVQETEVALLDWGRRDIVSLSHAGPQQSKEYYGFSKPVWRPTPATVTVASFLGEACLDDAQCRSVANGACLYGVCSCPDGFAEDADRRTCVENLPPVTVVEEINPARMSSCSSFPCLYGGTCQPLGVESFVCTCPPERTGALCERALSRAEEEMDPAETPAFHGQSYVELKKMKGHDKFSMEVEFKSLLMDGILIYAQQRKEVDPDYISLAIVGGHVELRYNVGNGLAVLRSLQPIRLGHWHRVIAQRYRQDGWLRLDDDEDVATTSPGEHSSLDLDTNTFLGAVPPKLASARVYENMGTSSGFVGCMRRVKIGRRSVAFKVAPEGRKVSRRGRHYDSDDKKRGNSIEPGSKPALPPTSGVSTVVRMMGITQCGENPCWKSPCANHGTCVWKTGDNFTCVCRPEFTGPTCETLFDSCASNPCSDGATCVSSKHRFTCKCPPGRKGPLCDQHDGSKHDILVPDFGGFASPGASYVAITRQFHVNQNLDLEVWFLSRSSDGMLLYSARDENGRGDFVWLALIGGRLQFRWDLGSGAGIVTSTERVSLFGWHRVLVSRRGKEASIRLDDGTVTEGRSFGPLSELNLEIPLFVGGLRPNLTLPREVPKLGNFQGAIQRVIVNGEVFERLMETGAEQQNVAVYRGPPCGHMPITHSTLLSRPFASQLTDRDMATPCQNGGVCQPLLATFICKCQPGFLGKRCEKRTDEAVFNRPIRFDGKTHLKYPNQLKDVVKSQRSNRFEIRFRTEAENGMILWLSRGHSLQADYFAIAIVKSHVELSFNLGKQSAYLSARSTINVSDGKWHSVVVERKKRLGSVSVDGERPVRATADPGATILNSNGKLWIGGTTTLPAGLPSPYYEPFIGCMEKVKVDRQSLDWHRHGDNAILHYCEESRIA